MAAFESRPEPPNFGATDPFPYDQDACDFIAAASDDLEDAYENFRLPSYTTRIVRRFQLLAALTKISKAFAEEQYYRSTC